MQPYAKLMLISGKISSSLKYEKTRRNGLNTMFKPFLLLAGVEGLEPSRTVLETGMLPLHHTPKGGHRFYADDAWPIVHKFIGK